MIRTGLHRFVRHADVPAFLARGWMVVDDLAGTPHGAWSVMCWHCDCGQVQP